MTGKHLLIGLLFGVSTSFISWIFGMLINSILIKTPYYKKLSNLNFIKSDTLNKQLDIGRFKWIVENTFFKYFNQKIKVENRKTDLTTIRYEMTLAEISHLIGFVFVILVAVYYSVTKSLVFGLMMMPGNVLMNLYPALLQQKNKRRIDKITTKRV